MPRLDLQRAPHLRSLARSSAAPRRSRRISRSSPPTTASACSPGSRGARADDVQAASAVHRHARPRVRGRRRARLSARLARQRASWRLHHKLRGGSDTGAITRARRFCLGAKSALRGTIAAMPRLQSRLLLWRRSSHARDSSCPMAVTPTGGSAWSDRSSRYARQHWLLDERLRRRVSPNAGAGPGEARE